MEGILKADTLTLTHLFNKPVCYLVPLFQRPYVWNKAKHWEPLWDDVRHIAERLLVERSSSTPEERDQGLAEQRTPAHFLGAVVMEQIPTGSGMIDRRHIIDGQQRLTTLQVFLDAAHDVAEETGDPTARLFSKLTENDSDLVQQPSDHYKVWPTNFDAKAFQATMAKGAEDAPSEDVTKSQLWQAHDYFCVAMKQWLTSDETVTAHDRLDALRTVMWQLIRVVVIDLEPADNAQIIFETLNARGTPLLASDLIKNAIFQHAAELHLDISKLYAEHWQPLDTDWWREEIAQGRLSRPRLDIFFFHWLTMRRGTEFGVHELFPAFKRFAAENGGPDVILEDIAHYTHAYRAFEHYAVGSEEEIFFYRMRATEITTSTPLLLYAFGSRDSKIDADQRLRLIRAIESWLIRRMICRLTTKNYNVVFLSLLQRVKANRGTCGDIAVDFLRRLQGESQLWPTDGEVAEALRILPLYKVLGRGRLRVVLEAIEDSLRPDDVEQKQGPRNLTIEHVLPQSWESYWPLAPEKADLEGRTRRNTLLHSLGNLTLVTKKLNPKLSNAPWNEKRLTLHDHTVLFLNKDIVNHYQSWDEDAISLRGEELASKVIAIWLGPESGGWGTPFTVDRTRLEVPDDLSDIELDDSEGADSEIETWSHDVIRVHLRRESLRPLVDEFEAWALGAGLTVRHNRRSSHVLLAGGKRIGGYYFARNWIHFTFRGQLPDDALLSAAPGVAVYRVNPGYVSANVTETSAIEHVKRSIMARA